MTRRSLESIYDKIAFPFALIYLDDGSPTATRRYLDGQARARGGFGRSAPSGTLRLGSGPSYISPRARSERARSSAERQCKRYPFSVLRATSLLPVIDLFFSASRICPVRTRQAQARR
jgi:hypothetical protein